jgi:hypothetical protein
LRRSLNGAGRVPGWNGEESAVLRESLLLLYCTIIGFVTSGITASFFKWTTAKPARFAMLGDGAFGAATTMAFCAVSGPAIIAEMAVTRSLPSSNTPGWIAGCLLVAALWSACSGVIVLQIVVVLAA